jgi:hypothetical protein
MVQISFGMVQISFGIQEEFSSIFYGNPLKWHISEVGDLSPRVLIDGWSILTSGL